MNTPSVYEICVRSHLGAASAGIFNDFGIRHTADGNTLLTGVIVDQAALHGVLSKIRDLGLVLISVRAIQSAQDQ